MATGEIKITEVVTITADDITSDDYFLVIDGGKFRRIDRDSLYAQLSDLARGPKGDTGATGIGIKGDKGDRGFKGDKGDTGATGVGIKGDKGDKGDKGWSSILSVVNDGSRCVLKVHDWTGGDGTKPASSQYLTTTGFSSNIADAVDIRGVQGLQGIQGLKGNKGDKGDTGASGKEIFDATYNPDGSITLTFSDDSQVSTGLPPTRVRELGWASYTDTVFTDTSPLTINEGVETILTNNAGVVIDSAIPDGVTSFYDSATNKITPINVDDGLHFSIRFKAVPSSNNVYLVVGVDIGFPSNIFQSANILPRGVGVVNPVNIEIQGYSKSTFITNGGLIKLTPYNGDVNIYDIEFQIHRTSVGAN